MTEELRRRRAALLEELQAVNMALGERHQDTTEPGHDTGGGKPEGNDLLALERSVLQTLVAHAPDHIMLVDRAHRAQFANRIRLGFERDAVIGKPVENLVMEEHRAALHDAIEAVFDAGSPRSLDVLVEGPAERREFSVRIGPIMTDGEVARVSLVSTDITERVRLDEARRRERDALAQSEARFRILVEYAPEAVVILSIDDWRFVDVNENACKLFKLPRAQLLNSGPVDLSPEIQPNGTPSRQGAIARLQQALAGEHPVFEWVHRNADGEFFPCEIRLVRLPDRTHRLVRGSIIDISDRKRAEEERQRLATDLLQAQKMQAMGQLTGGVAHDFNNLLTVITSSVEMIDLDAEDSEQVRKHAAYAMGAAERAAALTQHLLAFARRQPLRPRIINVNKLILGTESLLRRTLGETIEIETVLGGGLWSCEADPSQLENVILNLAINARDAMPDGGRLTIETANARLDREYALAHREVEPGQYVMLAVTDNGHGMADDVLQQAFEPFFTTKSAGRGSGLGLSMIYGFVKQSGGHIKIYSEPHEGTTVRVYLPRCASAERADNVMHGPGQAPAGDGRRLLVVEDEPSVRGVVVQMLERIGYQTVPAMDGPTALAALQAHEDIVMMVTDVVLPGGMNGAELASRARALRPHLKILFMSGYTENAIIHNGRLDPGVSLLEKPFTQRALALAVLEAFGTRD